MKHKTVFVTVAILLLCLVLPVKLVHSHVYGDSSNNKSEIQGVVSSVLGPIISIINNNIDIDASKAKVKIEDCNVSLNVSDIVAGDAIEAKGYIKNESFVAEKIKLIGSAKLEGAVTEVGNNTITLLGQVVDISSVLCIKGTPTIGKKARAYVRNSGSGLIAIAIKAE